MQQLQTGVYDGAAEGVVVSGTACRGSDEDAVSAEPFDKTVSNGDVKVNGIGISKDHFVEALVDNSPCGVRTVA